MNDDVAPPMKGTRAQRVRRASQERRAQQKEDLRQAILHAAGELLLKHGYEDFSLRQVAEFLGYSPTTIYLYFENKDALLFEVTDEAYRVFCETQDRALRSTDDLLERLIASGRAYVEFGLTHPTAYKLMFVQRVDYLLGCIDGESKPRIATFQTTQAAVEEAMAAGLLRQGDPTVLFAVLMSTMHGIVMMALTMPTFDAKTTQAVLEMAIKVVMEGILARPEP